MAQTRPTVLVTGAARRIGANVAQAFAEDGWHVAIHYRTSGDEAKDLAARLPLADVWQADLASTNGPEDLARDIAERHDGWQALVCSAAVFEADGADRLDPVIFERAMATNARGVAAMTQAFFRHAHPLAHRSAILLTDQKLANSNPDFFSYSMSKHALGGAVTMLAQANTRPGDRVYALAPGAILPSHDQSEDEIEVSHRLNLLARMTTAQEIARGAVFLASGALASGETLFIDSGQHLLEQRRDVIYLAREQVDLPQ